MTEPTPAERPRGGHRPRLPDARGPLDRRQALLWLGGAGVVLIGAACSKGGSSAVTSGPTSTTVSDELVVDGTTSTTTPTTAAPAPSSTSTTAATTTSTAAPAAPAAPSSTAAPASTTTTSQPAGTPTTTAAAAPTCVLTPQMTEGPYYIAGSAGRRDITEGKPGVPLTLALNVVAASSCTVIEGATVEVWHSDAAGSYSGFGAAGSNRTFLRGAQDTDSAGNVVFDTVYPGWYQGRATHIHVKVRVKGTTHTTQLFFDEAVNDAVYARAPYDGRSGRRTLNRQDGIFSGGGSTTILELTPSGAGYVGSLTLGVRA